MGAEGERPEFDIKLPFGVPLVIFLQRYLLKSFPKGDTFARQQWFEIRVFTLLCISTKAVEPHLPACQLCRLQICSNTWSSTMTKSLDPIEVTAILVDFPWE